MKKYLFIFMGGSGTNDIETRCVLQCPKIEQIVVGVPSMEKAINVAKEFAGKVESIELCGYFGESKAAEISKALGGKCKVGSVKYSED